MKENLTGYGNAVSVANDYIDYEEENCDYEMRGAIGGEILIDPDSTLTSAGSINVGRLSLLGDNIKFTIKPDTNSIINQLTFAGSSSEFILGHGAILIINKINTNGNNNKFILEGNTKVTIEENGIIDTVVLKDNAKLVIESGASLTVGEIIGLEGDAPLIRIQLESGARLIYHGEVFQADQEPAGNQLGEDEIFVGIESFSDDSAGPSGDEHPLEIMGDVGALEQTGDTL
ncbi:MAG: hypothetical protein Tsb006_1870 [Rickettsiaceae bacterium]